MAGGGEAWIEAGLPVIQPIGPGTASALPRRVVRLPDLIDPAQLKRMLMDLPGTFDLIDIRPEEHFKDYHLPGSRNVDIADLIANVAYLTGVGPLVIVDRNGSLAMAAGGILSTPMPPRSTRTPKRTSSAISCWAGLTATSSTETCARTFW